MSIYRGAGGSGDAVADSSSEALLVRELAIEVQADADAAATSATNSANSASAAATSATNAANSATAAASSATSASNSASAASTSASNAATSATAAQTAETNAETAETNAETAQAAAATSATNAASSASAASTSATNASNSASAASTSATNASNSASAAATSATNAASSATSASGSATTATTQASNASTSATNAASSATSAAGSATTATTQAGIATTQATNAASSASAASTSATNASNSATSAATQATTASSSATAAAGSATSAAASYDSFDDRYLGAKSSAPTLDNDGAALLNGALYFDSTLSAMRVYSTATSTWATIQQGITNTEATRHSVRPSLLLDFANTKSLDPRITFTRASTATFYDGKTTVKAEENLLLQSQTFDNASWVKSATTVTANTTVAPDGTTTAETLAEDTSTGRHFIYENGLGIVASKTYSFSVYAKNISGQYINLSVLNVANSTSYSAAIFDLSTGVVSSSAASGTGYSVVSTNITNAGGGWYRCELVVTTGTSVDSMLAGLATANSTTIDLYGLTSYAGTSRSIAIWGAQLEQRSSATAYTPTTTAPITNYIPALQTATSGTARFDHNPTTGESLGLLIEEQRTNLLTYSDDLSNAAWSKSEATVYANATVSPDGTLTADKIVESATANAVHLVYEGATVTAQAYTWSAYVKAAGRTQAYIRAQAPHQWYAFFNLSTGAVISTSDAGLTATITSVGNGWYRITATTTASAGSGYFVVGPASAGSATYTGNGFDGIYIWGAQLEAGSFATSYIPTVASQVTRSADSASMTGTNFSSWYRADEGSFTTQILPTGVVSGKFPNVYAASDGTNANSIRLFLDAQYSTTGFTVIAGNTSQCSLNMGAPTNNAVVSFASAYKVNDFSTSRNGATVVTDALGTLPVIDRLQLGRDGASGSSNPYSGTIKKLAYYPKRLVNEELVALTTI